MRRLFLDVGANDGSWGHRMAQSHPDHYVIAFEPVPYLAEKCRTNAPPNYEVHEVAIGAKTGKDVMKVTAGDGGCSSLMEPCAPEELVRRGWNRPDIVVQDRVEVDVYRLDDILQPNIPTIEFLHIDAQGLDLAVLESLGTLISKVKAGELEAAIDPDRAIYRDQTLSVDVACARLKELGFRSMTIPHDNGLEADIRFWRDPCKSQ